MTVSILALPVKTGRESEVRRFYSERKVFALAGQSGGFRSGLLLAPRDAGEPWLVLAELAHAADYDRWLTDPVRAELGESLSEHLDGEPTGRVYHRAEVFRK
jgi:hypothetical protein